MHFFTPKAIQNLCQQYGLKPSRDYGQNYLLSLEPIEAMLKAAEIKKTDTIVEIGPGFGALTCGLADEAGKVIAFEIEKKIEKYWQEKTKEYPNVEIVWGNVLRMFCHFERGLKADEKSPSDAIDDNGDPPHSFGMTVGEPYKVVANIPYQITSPLIKLFLEDIKNKPELMVLMVQKEVAERICAKPGDMSVLAIAVQYFATPEIIIHVPRHFFYPIPEVDSAVIKITLKKFDKNQEENTKQFFKLVKTGFSSRRKILVKNLLPLVGGGSGLKKLQEIWEKLGYSRTIRAQELSVTDWIKLAQELAQSYPHTKKDEDVV
ncbi:MAG: ribosomal RNA small subunit methyltransferase A [Candidatus Magasanikbacteria bacterium RIFOXYC2_FULL_42_28]|uniref:Ribosomal RNA small subunit methyltransferase A n=1 Tax=Candidatus Magasanikbacteria bacterium RIFOXYC2_FULL_42_28 TaxID=1798704 RepID=A0A1F6NUP9_9BACT|nr:MAG: ribosomal RNA small subunit methyltransferase A [Candidatus Magasanikbacteria bacterium RIFOXYC2_FULL_42_28]